MHYIAKTIEISTIHFFTLIYSSPQFVTSLAPHRSYGLKNRVSCLVRMLKLRCTYHTYLTSTSHHSTRNPHISPTFTTSHMQHVSHTNKTQLHHTPLPELQTHLLTPPNIPPLPNHITTPIPHQHHPPTPTTTRHHHPHNNHHTRFIVVLKNTCL